MYLDALHKKSNASVSARISPVIDNKNQSRQGKSYSKGMPI